MARGEAPEFEEQPEACHVRIVEGGMLEASWTDVKLYWGDTLISERTLYGWFRKSRARRIARRLIEDAEEGILWS